MGYLLDTCVISEIAKPKPNKDVILWLKENDEDNFYLSVLTFGELYKGISKLRDSKKKELLCDWVENELKNRFKNKILDINFIIAEIWGNIEGKAESNGIVLPSIDALIASTGIAYDLTVVTRNTSDMERTGVKLLNPWVSV
ncbi:MAG: type II toxin-antitoxin system VapC family toxin [Candidatus Acidulodesulfobacterium acidiphilum]|uniref:Type II toxin-antitoxin system VapC family toxin n=1 Tax=Candidatus Acidulodesulfobacterium acidiphilum TaxID=2597224 RepID=A0A520XAF2_9DELT|nr:MAG: type II toxin-antitoxin system VapC family toxin [Candidatus Acidulodesulfobacterium acidiphilum]